MQQQQQREQQTERCLHCVRPLLLVSGTPGRTQRCLLRFEKKGHVWCRVMAVLNGTDWEASGNAVYIGIVYNSCVPCSFRCSRPFLVQQRRRLLGKKMLLLKGFFIWDCMHVSLELVMQGQLTRSKKKNSLSSVHLIFLPSHHHIETVWS